MMPGIEFLIQLLNSVLSLAVITLLFAMLFKFLPDAKIAWHDVWIGAFLTAVLFTWGSLRSSLSWKSSASSSYVLRLTYCLAFVVYYSSQILFFERSRRFTRIDSLARGSRRQFPFPESFRCRGPSFHTLRTHSSVKMARLSQSVFRDGSSKINSSVRCEIPIRQAVPARVQKMR